MCIRLLYQTSSLCWATGSLCKGCFSAICFCCSMPIQQWGDALTILCLDNSDSSVCKVLWYQGRGGVLFGDCSSGSACGKIKIVKNKVFVDEHSLFQTCLNCMLEYAKNIIIWYHVFQLAFKTYIQWFRCLALIFKRYVTQHAVFVLRKLLLW